MECALDSKGRWSINDIAMAEKVSGLMALGAIASLLCFFIPSATYTIYRMVVRRTYGGYPVFDGFVVLIAIMTMSAMLYIMTDAQRLYPRCDSSGEPQHLSLCYVNRYDDTGEAVVLPRVQAEALMRTDLLKDVAQCLVVPSLLGIAVLLMLTRLIISPQKPLIHNDS
jgi:hypothetical protein